MSHYVQDFSFDTKGLGNMTCKVSSENVSPMKIIGDDLNYHLVYNYSSEYAHRLINVGNRYYQYDANGNIVREKDGKFDEETVQYGQVINQETENVYSTDYGWGLYNDESSKTYEVQTYDRTYKWNARNQLISSIDANNQVAYVYGQDGQRTNKYTTSSETVYFNKMWTLHTDSGNSLYGGQYAQNIYLGDTRIVTKLNSGKDPTYQEESQKQYYYHSDHLGSASLISDYNGKEYQRIEYTPYGETWVEKTSNTGNEFLPYKFTGKEIDEETGLYYYGARYLDPKYSRWLSTDPALLSYASGSTAGGGIYNSINFNLYHYGGNNPVRYTDPTGLFDWDTNTIQEGDTLSQIAKDCNTRYGTNYTADDLQGLNSDTISDKDKIYAGNHLNLGKAEDVQKRAADYTNRATTQYSNEQVTPPSQKSNDVALSFGFGGKLALILGLGAEGGVIFDTSGNIYAYLSGSVGCGIQTPSTTKTDLSALQYLKKSVGPTGGFSLYPTQVGTTSSLTADICLGVTGTYDLNNQKSLGLPNSWGFGSVGGGVWKTGTVVLPVYRKER